MESQCMLYMAKGLSTAIVLEKSYQQATACVDRRNIMNSICTSRESNPGHIDGNDVFYH